MTDLVVMKRLLIVMSLAVFVGCDGTHEDDEGADVGEQQETQADTAVVDEPEPDASDGSDASVDAEGDGGASVTDLSGVWKKTVAASALTDTVVGGEEESTTRSVLRVEIEQQGQDVALVSQICSIDIVSESDFAETVIPDAFLDSLLPTERTGTFVDGVLDLPWAFEVRGVEFADGEDPETEPLPSDPDDPRVIDQDGDGNPGLSVFVDAGLVSGDIYVVQRGSDRMVGQMVSDDTLEGPLEWSDEQEILGASDDTLLLAEPTSRPNPDESASYFEMERVDETTHPDCEPFGN